jgi:hypothetical protein
MGPVHTLLEEDTLVEAAGITLVVMLTGPKP